MDYYRDDDDVAVLFTAADGSKYWVLGNIEEVAVARGSVDAKKAVGANGGSYLLGLDKDYRATGVFVNDPKAIFVLRWYREVDSKGEYFKSGFQHKSCKGYKLPFDNSGELFRWTSNCQLISKVYLHKSTTHPWYTFNTADRKMVQSAVSALS